MSSLDSHLQAELEAVTERTTAPPPPQQSPAIEMASSVGNRNMGPVISRMEDGEGILPSGIAHPVVESTIAAARGGGCRSPTVLSQQFGNVLGRSVDDVRVHTDQTAASLTKAVSARAFATGRDIFFAPGEYQPHTGARPRAHRP